MLRIRLFCLLSLLIVSPAKAATFDLIVPADVMIRSPLGISGVGSPWGWVVATDGPLTYERLNSAVFTLVTDNPLITVETTFYPSSSWMPMQIGDVAGLDNVPFTQAFRDLLRPGEVLNPLSSNFWRWLINFPPGFVGEVNLHTIMQVDELKTEFDTRLRLDPTFGTPTDVIQIVEAQRVTAVPEPGHCFIAAACAVLLIRRRHFIE